MPTDSQYSSARRASDERNFRAELLSVLTRIAIALENPLHEAELPEPIDPIGRSRVKQVPAEICTCGGDPKKACTECSPARLAWVYQQETQ